MRFIYTMLPVLLMPLGALGQTPNDGMDDTEAVQAYLDKLSDPSAVQRNPLPAGKLIISDTLRISHTMGLKVSGAGGQNRSPERGWDNVRLGTIFDWHGEADKPILELTGCTGLVLEGINFLGEASHGILIRDGQGSLNIALRDCGFVGQTVGIQCGTDRTESTCANITYDNCHFERMGEAGVRLMNRQSLQHLFLRPLFTWSPIAIDVQAGGNITVISGGTFEIDEFLKLGGVASNTRGFRVEGLRFDGNPTRTAWVNFYDTDRRRTYGIITFDNCTQNNGQKESDLPLVTAAPGSRVVLRDCSFSGGMENWAQVYSEKRNDDEWTPGELIVENCDGLDGNNLHELVTTKGARAFFAFERCGTLYGPTRSLRSLPVSDDVVTPEADDAVMPEASPDSAPEVMDALTPDEIAALRALLQRHEAILDAADGIEQIKSGRLEVTLPDAE